jgi:Dolichyl-phosphate-mannose-protein mannosyltransferase
MIAARRYIRSIGFQATLLGILVFLSRYLTRAKLYYVDGPILVRCIQNRTYVIQSPGYWLFAHMGGIFTDPAYGLQFWNQLFSSVGVAVFFLTCCKLGIGRPMAWMASIAYGSIFFVWLAGVVHSSYGSQILFAPLTLYCALCYRDKPTILRLLACGVSYAVGAGLRPSDGAFLAPLFLFLVFRCVEKWQRRILLLLVTATLCLSWYIPTQLALRAAHTASAGNQLSFAREVSPLLVGINLRSLANTLRVVFPILTAFWMLSPAMFFQRSREQNMILLLWITPGLGFMLFVFMADPVYLTFMSGAIILMAALSMQRPAAFGFLLLCAIFNIGLFLGAAPIRGASRADQAVNFYIVKYCFYGVRHQWTSTIGKGAVVP